MKPKTRVISVFDTTVAEYNLGNQIIMEAVFENLEEIWGDCFVYRLPYQQVTSSLEKCIKNSDFVFFGGTNSLSSFMNKYKQWDLNIWKTRYVQNVIMMGIGWWQYQKKPNLYTRIILKRALSANYIHSVRDSYTKEMLDGLGFKTLNTGCPTTWKLTPDHIERINNRKKADSVVITITDYNPNKQLDLQMIQICKKHYKTVYLWPQGVGDIKYLSQFTNVNELQVLGSSLKAYDDLLLSGSVDYVGTRLHAGIRALQKGCHAYIVGIDNRAREIAKDIALPVIDRTSIQNLDEWIGQSYHIELNIHWDEISQWKEQFIREVTNHG